MKKLIFVLSTVLLLVSACGQTKKKSDNQVENAIKQATKTLTELPEIEKEINEYEEKLNAQKVSGKFEVIVNGEKLETGSWDNSRSSINFFKDKANFNLPIAKKGYINIQIFAKDLHNNKNKDFSPTKFPILMTDTEFMRKISEGYIQISYKNEETEEKYHSGKGKVELKKLTDNELRISYTGDGMKGDWKNKEFVPLSFEVDLSYNFLTNDYRGK